MSKKDDLIAALREEVEQLEDDFADLSRDYHQKCYQLYNVQHLTPPAEKRRRRYFGSVALDFWPLSDWKRLSHSRWETGHYFQACVGPIRIDFAED